MLKYKVSRNPYDCEIMFERKLNRTINEGLTILVGCNGSGKSTTLRAIEYAYSDNDEYGIFTWDGLSDKSIYKQKALDDSDVNTLASLAFSSEGEEININLGMLFKNIGRFVRYNPDKNLIILLDGLDSGLSIDNIIETKDFFKNLLIPDTEKRGNKCYIIVSANEYELANGEQCIDVRTGEEILFNGYDEYKEFILKSKELKNEREWTR